MYCSRFQYHILQMYMCPCAGWASRPSGMCSVWTPATACQMNRWLTTSPTTMSWPGRTWWSRTSSATGRTWRKKAARWRRRTRMENTFISVSKHAYLSTSLLFSLTDTQIIDMRQSWLYSTFFLRVMGRFRARDVHAPGRLQFVCGGVSKESVQHLDHEALREGPGQRHLPH